MPTQTSPISILSRHPAIFILFSLLLMGSALLAISRPAHADEDTIKVVYHADFAEPRRFSSMLTSINNMITYYQDELVEYDIRIVFNAHGIRYVTDDKLSKTPFAEDKALSERRENIKGRMLSLHKVQNVKLELCEITRSQIGLAADKLYGGVEQVPSGVVRVAELQRQGFAYIKVE